MLLGYAIRTPAGKYAAISQQRFRPGNCQARPWWNAPTRFASISGDPPPRNPTTGIGGCCARTASSHAAAPPTVTKNSRRRMWMAMRPSRVGVMQRRERYHTWTCCAAGFQTGLCRLGVKTRIRPVRAYVSFHRQRTFSLRDAVRPRPLCLLAFQGAPTLAPWCSVCGRMQSSKL